MAHRYLVLGKYTAQGLAGALQEGFQSRHDNIANAVKSLGGKLIDYSFCAGEYDFTILTEWDDETKRLCFKWLQVLTDLFQAKLFDY